MASLLLAAGEPGQRRCLPHARIMLHQPLGAAEVSVAHAFEQHADGTTSGLPHAWEYFILTHSKTHASRPVATTWLDTTSFSIWFKFASSNMFARINAPLLF